VGGDKDEGGEESDIGGEEAVVVEQGGAKEEAVRPFFSFSA